MRAAVAARTKSEGVDSPDGSQGSEVFTWGRVPRNAPTEEEEFGSPSQILPTTAPELERKPVAQLSIGAFVAIALTDDGRALVSGTLYQPDHPSAKHVHTPTTNWWPVNYFQGLRIAQVACGVFFNLFLSESGQVLSCGQGKRGALGHGDTGDRADPALVKELKDERIAEVAAGSRHGAALTFDGSLYTWGAGGGGRLGIGDEIDRHCPQQALDVDELQGTSDEEVHVARVSCGYQHTVVLLDDGGIVTFGSGKRGQTGHGSTNAELWGRRVEHLGRERIVQVACGAWHTLMLTENGEVFATGCGSHGQLGIPEHGLKDVLEPNLVFALYGVRISSVTAGGSFSAAVTDEGGVYTWGSHNHGQLGRNCANSIDINPSLVAGLLPVETLTAGPLCMIALCTRGSHEREIKKEDEMVVGMQRNADGSFQPVRRPEAASVLGRGEPGSPQRHGVGGIPRGVPEETEILMTLFPEHVVSTPSPGSTPVP